MRESGSLLDSHEQQRLASELDRARIEHGVDHPREVRGHEQRIGVVSPEELTRMHVLVHRASAPVLLAGAADGHVGITTVSTGQRIDLIAAAGKLCDAISSACTVPIRASVDSAP